MNMIFIVDRNKKLFSRLVNKQRILVKMERLDEYDWEKSWKVMEKKLHERKKFSWKYWGMVASLLGIVLLGTWVFMEKNEKKSPVVVMRGVEPGGVFAELVLPDGKIVELNKDSNNLFLGESGKVLRNENGVLFLTQDSVQLQKVGYSEIRTPRGGEYQVVLPDNSIVWLNAESKLRFPSTFSGKERKVFASGELYFQVAKDSLSPFRVEVEGLYEVEVLGTEFNVRVNESESDCEFSAALLEGSIELINKMKPGPSIRLAPMQKAEWTGGKMMVESIRNLDDYRWKEGLICFEEIRFADLMKRFEKTYDIRIVIQNKSLHDYKCSGKCRVSDGVDFILQVLQRSTRFTFSRSDDNTIIYIK